jgi:r-opsin
MSFLHDSRILYCVIVPYSHPKYRAALTKKFPSLACATEDDTGSTASGTTTVSEEKSPGA